MALARLSVGVGKKGKAAPHALYIAREENNMKELKEKVNSFIEVKEEMTAREIKENVILKVNKNFDSTGKSDEAINATFDFAVETLQGMAQTETALDLVENSVKEAVKEESVIVTDFTKYRNYGGKN